MELSIPDLVTQPRGRLNSFCAIISLLCPSHCLCPPASSHRCLPYINPQTLVNSASNLPLICTKRKNACTTTDQGNVGFLPYLSQLLLPSPHSPSCRLHRASATTTTCISRHRARRRCSANRRPPADQ